MKLRNLANKLLLFVMLMVFAVGNFTVYAAPATAQLAPADTEITPLTKTYAFDKYNQNTPTGESLYEALGIKTYNNYLMALSATQKLKDVVIAVVDTGLDYGHNEGQGIKSNPVFNGRVLTEYAMDFSSGLPTELNNNWNTDLNGHGTHVAGIIADATLSNVKILPLKIFNGVGNDSGSYSFLNAIRYLCALKSGEQVSLLDEFGNESADKLPAVYYNTDKVKIDNIVAVNLSIGSEGYAVTDSDAMAEFNQKKEGYTDPATGIYYTGCQYIVNNLLKNGILPIAAAGNMGTNDTRYYWNNGRKDVLPYYSWPGACDGVLEVSAYDNTASVYSLASYSYCNDCVSVAAPGTEIWSACSSSILTKSHSLSASDLVNGIDYYTYRVGFPQSVTWYVMKDGDNQDGSDYCYCSSGTSMATPFVTACYAMLMSDPTKNNASDLGLTSWDANNEEDRKFLNVVHKALLAAAATDGFHAETYEEKFGYGTVSVVGFVPDSETGAIRTLKDINYEPQASATPEDYSNANWNGTGANRANGEIDWFIVCLILTVGVLLIWMLNAFKTYVLARNKGGDTEDDGEQQQ